MELIDLMGKTIEEMTDQELEERISLLTRSRIKEGGIHKRKVSKKSNKERQLNDLLSKLSENERANLITCLNKGENHV